MNNNFGIYEKSYTLIIDAIAEYPQIEKAIIFGSRAMGNYKKGSDIDIAIFGTEINYKITTSLVGKFNEQLPIPYFVEVVNFNTIDNDELKRHILNEGKRCYEKR